MSDLSLIATDDLEKIADILRLVGHPIRAFILHDLLEAENPRCVTQIVHAVGKVPQPIISQQLRILHDAGVVQRNRAGNRVFYQATSEVTPILAFLKELARSS